MHRFTALLLLAASSLLPEVLAANHTFHSPEAPVSAAAGNSTTSAAASSPNMRRQLMSCSQTYGPSSQKCGSEESTYCFDPSKGQTCCTLDNGYCSQGQYCAPVAGYCCNQGESNEDCAKNAGFTLPQSKPAGCRAKQPPPQTQPQPQPWQQPPAETTASTPPQPAAAPGNATGPPPAAAAALPGNGSVITPWAVVAGGSALTESRRSSWPALALGGALVVLVLA